MFDRARILGFLIVAAWPAAAWPTAAQSQTLVPPVAVDLVEASWPEAEPIAGRGMVEVLTRLAIDATGVVTDVEILGSAGALFDEAARAALLASRFEPALRDGAPIAARIELRFVFRAPAPHPSPEPEPEAAAPSPVVVPPAVDDGPELGVAARVRADAEAAERSAEAVDAVDTRAVQHRSLDLGEVLARETGVSVRRGGGLGSGTRFSLAGLQGDQIRYFLDGVPLGVAGYPFGLANVPITLVDRVDIYRGVVPIRLGADALGGAVDLVSAERLRRTFGQASYQTGSFATYRASITGRLHDPDSGWTAGAVAFFDHSDNDYPVDVEVPDARGRLEPARVRRFHDAYTAFGGSVDVGVVDRPWARRLTLRLFGAGYRRDLQHNVVMTIPYGEAEHGEQVYGGTARYAIHDALVPDLDLDVVVSLARRQIDFVDVGDAVYDWFGAEVRARRVPGETSSTASDRTLVEWQSFARVHAAWTPSPEHQLSVSITPSHTARSGEERRVTDPNERDPLSAEQSLLTLVSGVSHRLRLFEERLENIAFAKHYLLVADTEEALPGGVFRGLSRDTHFAGAGDALRFRITEALWVKASYEYATRLPRPDELFGDGVLIGPNLELEPETSHNVNAGAQLDLHDERGTGRWRAEAYFFARVSDRLVTLLGTDRSLRYENVLSATTLGGELGVAWDSPGRYVSVGVNGTYQDQRNTSSDGPFAAYAGDRIPNRPWLFANARLGLRWPRPFGAHDALSLGADARYVHELYRGWESQGLRAFKQTVDAQLVIGASLSYRIEGPPTVVATFEVTNLTDARVYDFFGVQRPGRALAFKLMVEL